MEMSSTHKLQACSKVQAMAVHTAAQGCGLPLLCSWVSAVTSTKQNMLKLHAHTPHLLHKRPLCNWHRPTLLTIPLSLPAALLCQYVLSSP